MASSKTSKALGAAGRKRFGVSSTAPRLFENKPKDIDTSRWEEMSDTSSESQGMGSFPILLTNVSSVEFKAAMGELSPISLEGAKAVLDIRRLLAVPVPQALIKDKYHELSSVSGSWSKARSALMGNYTWFSRNKMATDMPDSTLMVHALVCLRTAFYLAKTHKILDVDGLFNPNFPSASDITLYDDAHGVMYLDLTSSRLRKSKLSNLVLSSKSVAIEPLKEVSCWILEFDSQVTHPGFTQDSGVEEVVWGENPERVTQLLAKAMQGALNSEKAALVELLRDAIEPALAPLIPSKEKNDNSVDLLAGAYELVREVIKEEEGVDDDLADDTIKSLFQGQMRGISRAFSLVRNKLKKITNKSLQRLITAGDEGVLCRRKPKLFELPPPVSSPFNALTLHPNLQLVDFFLWVNVRARELNEAWLEGGETTYTFLDDGTFRASTFEEKRVMDFDVQQDLLTRFPRRVVAMVNLLPYDADEVVADKVNDGLGKRSKITPSYYQLLFNPDYIGCDNFELFLRRRGDMDPDHHREEFVAPSDVVFDEEDYMERIAVDMIPSSLEAICQGACMRSTRWKTDVVFRNKAPKSLVDFQAVYEGRQGSTLINLMDGKSSQARAFSVLTRVKHPYNCVVTLESPDVCLVGIWYLPGSWPNFSTTWRRFYSVNESTDLNLYDTSPLFRVGGFKGDGLYFTKYCLPVSKDFIGALPEHKPSLAALAGRVSGHKPEVSRGALRLCKVSAGKFHSVDKMNLEWEIELPYKALNRVASLCEMRHALYHDLSVNPIGKTLYEDLQEININLLSFIPNRQQFSVLTTAWRYLHQGLGSIDFEPGATLKKLKGISIKSVVELAYLRRMEAIYKFALLFRVKHGINSIRATNREVFVSMPDLCFASNSPSLNVSSYSTSNLLNVTKTWRVSSEAACVEAAWEQGDAYDEVLREDKHLWIGMPQRLYNHLLSMEAFSLKDLMAVLGYYKDDLREYTKDLISHETPINYCSNYWFEVMIHVQLSLDFQSKLMNADKALGGRDLSEFLTMKGSLIATELENFDSTPACRKATAMTILFSRLLTQSTKPSEAKDFVALGETASSTNMDQLALLEKLMTTPYVRTMDPICQFSEKDAPGKDREISTLNIEFGMVCLLCEKICQDLSASIPEDLVTHSAKEWSIYKSVLHLERLRDKDDSLDVLFINQDKSKYGPNRKVNSMLLTAAILCEDDKTYKAFELALFMSSKKKVCYPHQLVSQALRLAQHHTTLENERRSKTRVVRMTQEARPKMFGKTAKIMSEIYTQFMKGNKRGKRGSTWVQLREGMPGQGIFTTLSSISHAALQRYSSSFVKEKLNWHWEARVTSDDSMTMIVHPKRDNILIHNGIKTLVAGLTYQMGLIENKAKMTITARRPEMNTFYMLRGEPICALWKFNNAFCSMQYSGNLGEDLLMACSKSSDLLRLGGSVFSSAYLASTVITMTLDAYRMWGPYLGSDSDGNQTLSMLWDMPSEVFGIPSIDPISSIISPIGTRICSILGELNDSDDVERYVQYLLGANLSASKIDQDKMGKDEEGNTIAGGLITYQTKEGVISTLAPKFPPTVNGLLGGLNKRKKAIKVAKELGAVLMAFPEKTIFGGWSLKRCLEKNSSAFTLPLKRGHEQVSILDNYISVMHNPNYKGLSVSSNSFFPAELKGSRLSYNDLRALLKSRDFVKEIHKSFLNGIRTPMAFSDNIKPLYDELLRQAGVVSRVTDLLRTSRVTPNMTKGGYSESNSEKALGKGAFRRLIQLNKSGSVANAINYDLIKQDLISKYIADVDLTLPQLLGLSLKPSGDMTETEALTQAEVSLDRLKSLVPKQMILYSETKLGLSEKRSEASDWLKYNAFTDHHFSIPEALVRLASEPADAGAPIPADDTTVSQVLWSYHRGITEGASKNKYDFNPLNGALIFRAEAGNTAPAWQRSMTQEEVTMAARDKQEFLVSLALILDLSSNLSTNLWYGGPNSRVKVHKANLLDTEEGPLLFMDVSSAGFESRLYKHQLVIIGTKTKDSVRKGGRVQAEVDKWFSKYAPGFGVDSQPVIRGNDVYEVRQLAMGSSFSVSINFMDVFLHEDQEKLPIPTGIMVSLARRERQVTSQFSESVPKRKNVESGIKIGRFPKVPLSLLTEEDQKLWLEELKPGFEALTDSTSSVDVRQLIMDLAGSFLISGTSTNRHLYANIENEAVHEIKGLSSRVARSRAFSKFSKMIPAGAMPLVQGFYEEWDKVSSLTLETEEILDLDVRNEARVNENDLVMVRYMTSKLSPGIAFDEQSKAETLTHLELFKSLQTSLDSISKELVEGGKPNEVEANSSRATLPKDDEDLETAYSKLMSGEDSAAQLSMISSKVGGRPEGFTFSFE